MKLVYLVVAVALGLSSVASSAPFCMTGSLDDYLSLGADGCMVGSSTFSNFWTLSPPTTGDPISASSVSVMPVGSSLDPGLTFGLGVSAGANENRQLLLGFVVSGPPFIGASNSISGYSATGDGAVTATENLCIGGTFDPGTLNNCSGSSDALIAAATANFAIPADFRAFAAAASIGVVTNIAVDGGTAGAASLSSVTHQFTAVPEPGTILCCVAGLAALAAKQRCRRRTRLNS